MKDPLDNKPRAYEVLGLRRSVTLAEINATYARLAKESPSRRPELTNAWQRLRRPETRLEEDFWYYAVGDAEGGERVIADSREEFPWDPALPPLEIGLELTDLAEDRYRRDFGPLELRDIELSDVDRYDEEPAAALPLVFDK